MRLRKSISIIVEGNRGRPRLKWGVKLCSPLLHRHELKLQPTQRTTRMLQEANCLLFLRGERQELLGLVNPGFGTSE